MKAKILIVDDERNVRLMYRSALETNYFVDEAGSGAEALELFALNRYHAAVLDLRMPGMDGLELLEKMNDAGIKTPAVIITAFGDVPNAVNAMKLGAIDFLQKPLTPAELREIIADVLRRHRPETTQSLPHDFDYHLLLSKRAVNLRDFASARRSVARALELNPDSPQAWNLSGVMWEMQEDYGQAKTCYGRAITLDSRFEPAQQNMRRIFELFHFGSSNEPYNLENA